MSFNLRHCEPSPLRDTRPHTGPARTAYTGPAGNAVRLVADVVAAIICIDPQPMHFAASLDLSLPTTGILFRPGTRGRMNCSRRRNQIDRHAQRLCCRTACRNHPGRLVHRKRIKLLLLSCLGLIFQIVRVPDTQNVTAFHIKMDLRGCDLRASAGLFSILPVPKLARLTAGHPTRCTQARSDPSRRVRP